MPAPPNTRHAHTPTHSSSTSSSSIPTTSSIDDYTLGSLLGRGGFAEVYRARHCSGTDVAIKFISKSKITDKSMSERVENEINIHSQLKHHCIVDVIECFEDEKFVCIVLELCVNGNMYRYLKSHGRLEEACAAKYCFQLLEAVQYLQSVHGVIHRDLKLSNILLDEQHNIKLCDFGLATRLGHPDEEHFTICGTPNYIAPEVASQQAHGFPVDLWSLGCLLFAMLTGEPPFEQQGGVQETLQRIVEGKYAMPDHISQEAQDFLRSLLDLDPTARSNVQQTMHHPFLQRFKSIKDTPSMVRSSISSVGSIRDRDMNGSFAATCLVSYDGRTVDADNRTTANDYAINEPENSYVDAVEESTLNSELYPQQLRLLPHKQQSFELRGHSTSIVVHDHRSVPSVANPSHHQSTSDSMRRSHDLSRALFPVSPAHDEPQKPTLNNQYNDYHIQPHHDHQLRQSYPLQQRTSPLQHDPRPNNGHLLLNACSPGGKGNSMAMSLDSSLHCGLSGSYSVHGSVHRTVNSSMSSADFDFSRHNSLLHSQSMMSSGKSSRASTPSPAGSRRSGRSSFSEREGGRRLWIPRSSNQGGGGNQEFCYCAPRGDVLIVSKSGDVVYLTYLNDKSNNLRPCRLSVRASNPLKLLLGKVTKEMCCEIRDIRESALQGNAFSVSDHGDQDGKSKNPDDDTRFLGSNDESLDRSSGGGFIGKESFPDQSLDILSDTLWITSYHVTKLPSSLRKPYQTVARMLEAVKCKLPKLILYLTEDDSSKQESPHDHAWKSKIKEQKAVCKCMIMCNDPLPDFSVRWVDGTKLRYSLSNGNLHITNNSGSKDNHYRWEGSASTAADWTTSAPKEIRKYLLLAQSAMRRCIAEDIRQQRDNEDIDSTKQIRPVNYPIVVVDSISNM